MMPPSKLASPSSSWRSRLRRSAWSSSSCHWSYIASIQRRSASKAVSPGNGTTLDANKRWPDLLAQRLLATQDNGKVPAVLNASLSGNRLNHEGPEPGAGGFPGFVQLGTNAGARLNEDVFSQIGVRTVVFDLGIDDIWMNGDSADAIINSIRQIAAQVRERGLRFVVATLAPYEGFSVTPGAPADEWTPAKEATRTAVNAYLRSSEEFDGVIDFDAVLRDPANPITLRAEFDSGDHFHPNDAGNPGDGGLRATQLGPELAVSDPRA